VNPIMQVVEGQVLSGTVVGVAPFGLYILVAPRLDGLLSFDRTPYPEIAKLFRVGDTLEVRVRIANVERDDLRLELLPDPTRYQGYWAHENKQSEPVAPDVPIDKGRQ
jgi:ribosomal protein S1